MGRSFGSIRCDVTSDEANAHIVAASFTRTRAEARERVLPRRVESDRSHKRGAEATLLRLTASRETLEGSIGERMSGGTSRSGCARAPSPGGCLPLAGHRSGTQAQDTQREFDDISLGVRILSTFEPGRSLCRFASPTPSALRVSHSLSGLSPPGPRGFVSRHIRP